MIKSTINIKGMHCRSCEILIEDELKKLPEISNVSVNHKTELPTFILKRRLTKTKFPRQLKTLDTVLEKKKN